MKNQDPDPQLEELMHARLRALPAPVAPADLIEKVLRRVEALQHRPWWRNPWLEWPRGMRILSSLLYAALVVVLAVGLWQAAPALNAAVGRGTAYAAARLQFLHPAASVAGALGELARQLAGEVRTSWLVAGLTVVAAIYLCTVALGTVFYRVAAGHKAI